MGQEKVKKRSRGRPAGSDANRRQALLNAARKRFLAAPYNRVTTRDLAAEAGVDSGLISYYFGSKENLYQTMITEFYSGSLARLKQMRTDPLPDNLQELFDMIYDVHRRNPELSLLIFRTLVLREGPSRTFLLQEIVNQVRQYVIDVFAAMQKNGVIDPALDTDMLEHAFAGMSLRPFHLRELWVKRMGEEEADLYIRRLFRQNAQLFEKAVRRS